MIALHDFCACEILLQHQAEHLLMLPHKHVGLAPIIDLWYSGERQGSTL